MMKNLKTILNEFDANTELIRDLRMSCRLDPTPDNLQALGAHLLWRESLRIQALRIYFSMIE